MHDPNQTPLIVLIVPCRSITEDQIRLNNYLWTVVAFKKKGSLFIKKMASNKYRIIISAEQAQSSDFRFYERQVIHSKQEFVCDSSGQMSHCRNLSKYSKTQFTCNINSANPAKI